MSDKNKTDVSVLIPMHTVENDTMTFFDKAIGSIKNSTTEPKEILIIYPQGNEDIKKSLDEYDFEHLKESIRLIENTEGTDFCSQINFGVEQVNTEYFSILELDDEYSIIWFKVFDEYKNSYTDVDIYLPIVIDVNNEGKFIHFTNEAIWAKDFSDKQGFLDNDSLLNYPNFQLSGAIINTETYKTLGGLKPSIKLQFVYEFMLRATYYDKKIMTIPKLGYKKVNMRPGSLFHSYYQVPETRIDPIEARFWHNTAKKESYFKKDREIKYEETTS